MTINKKASAPEIKPLSRRTEQQSRFLWGLTLGARGRHKASPYEGILDALLDRQRRYLLLADFLIVPTTAHCTGFSVVYGLAFYSTMEQRCQATAQHIDAPQPWRLNDNQLYPTGRSCRQNGVPVRPKARAQSNACVASMGRMLRFTRVES